ncbi:hypothetical protein B566_EDAN004455 [Ephemera danica]|nr:hypothetical protein B566_EDAN004455 [Ephemera danica]
MGKNNRHKKFLKQEKAKVQLKASKKLTKGQNITDTSFKVKKIVLQNQLTTTSEDQPQNKRNLNLKELLSRSKHHNVNMRLEALSGLRELAVMHPEVLTSNLCNFLETSAARCSNEDSHLVRQESLRLLHYVLDKVSTAQLEPFIAMLILHLSTGMTHLQRGIQEDALRMLDIVLAVAPNLVAQAAPILLPAFLDQISVKQATGKRTLSLNLQSSHTSTNWRIKVLGRLHAMLSATSDCNALVDSAVAEPKQILWTPNCSPYVPLYVTKCDIPCTIQGVFPTGPTDLRGQQNLFQDEAEMKKYVSILVPLLFEIWAEVGPSQKQQRDIGSVIPTDAAELLDCVLETLQHLWQYMEMCEKGTNAREMTKWFCQSFRIDFLHHLVEHFPYYTTVDQSKKARRSKGQSPFEQEPEISCHKQNLTICYLFCCLCNKPTNKQAQNIYSYITKNSLDSLKQKLPTSKLLIFISTPVL